MNNENTTQETEEDTASDFIVPWMKKKVPMGCPMCGSKDWYTGDEVDLEKWERPGTIKLSGSGTRVFLAICSNCFFTAPFASEPIKRDWACIKFEEAFAESDIEKRKATIDALSTFRDAEVVLDAGLHAFSEHGNIDRLTLLIDILALMGGDRILHPLQNLAKHAFAWQSTFVDLVASDDVFSDRQRLQLLKLFAISDELETRERVLEIAEDLGPELRSPLLELLSRDKDEDLAESARAALHSKDIMEKVPKECPMCGMEDWYIPENVVDVKKYLRPMVKSFLAICSNCNFTAQVSAGLIREPVDADAK